MLLYTMLYIVLAYLMLFAALTNSVCLNNASFFFLFKYFLCQGYELSGEIALKNNHYYYYYYLRTKTSLLSLFTVDRLKELNIGYHLPRRHRSSRGVKRKKQNFHSFIVASFNAQSVKGNDMACKRCEISTFIKDNGVDLFL